MLVGRGPFDCALPLQTWSSDPQKSDTDNLMSLVECYSQAYRRLVIEVRRLEADPALSSQQKAKNSEYSEVQEIVDASIGYLDLVQE